MRRVELTFLLLATIVAVALGVDSTAAAQNPSLAEQLRPLDLRVLGGEANWHPDDNFRIDWDRPPIADQGFPIVVVHFRVLDAAGTVVVPERRLPAETTGVENIRLPSRGAYLAEVWLEGPDGAQGPKEGATLRFDDARPGTVSLHGPTEWVAADAPATLTIEHPAGPLPLSGIRGYAVSVDGFAGPSTPCVANDRCSEAETDLNGGIGDDSISLHGLHEGLDLVRAVAVSGSGMHSAQSASTVVRVDATSPALALAAPRVWAAGPVRVTARATDELSGMAASGSAGPFTAISIDSGVPHAEPGDSTATTVSGEGVHRVAYFARDAAGNVEAETPAVSLVRIDETPPVVSFARAQSAADPERIEATVSDRLSGADAGRGSIAVRPAGSHRAFEPLPTAASPGLLVARWDSESYPPGNYEFAATAHDEAGNRSTSGRRSGGARMILTNPLKAGAEIHAGLGPRWRAKATALRYGRSVVFGGRLTSALGTPLPHQPVQIIETFAAGSAAERRTTTVVTGADGAFRTHLSPGPNRQVKAAFAGTPTIGRSASTPIEVAARTGVRLHASSSSARVGGAPVVFGGRIGDLGAPVPADGLAVELQFRLAGRPWTEFRTVQTDRRGRFRYAYAFSDDDSRGVRFQFRAFVPADQDWPYQPAGSRPVLVTGR